MRPDKWQLLTAVEGCRESFGLRGTSISVLRAMISLISGDRISHAKPTQHICFASNATLAQRTHVSVQTVERHITKLVELGLIDRCAAANGKRWARRDSSGAIVLASGLSLLPLLFRYSELSDRAQRFAEQKASLKALRDRCSLALAQLMASGKGGRVDALSDKARLILRRKPDGNVLQRLLEEITVEIRQTTQAQPLKTEGAGTRNEGHKETIKTRNVGRDGQGTREETTPDFETTFPRLCGELRRARNQADCTRMMDDIATQIGLAESWRHARTLGPKASFLLLGYILERIETIQRPVAYARYLIRLVTTSENGLEHLVTSPPRRAVT